MATEQEVGEEAFAKIYKLIMRATKPEDVFGIAPGIAPCPDLGIVSEGDIKKAYTDMMKIVLPYHQAQERQTKYMAEEATRVLGELYTQAQKRLTKGIYGKPEEMSSSLHPSQIIFQMNGLEYHLSSTCCGGDFSTVYFGERQQAAGVTGAAGATEGNVEAICLKIANDAADNDLLNREAQVLPKVVHRSLPVLLESFQLEDGKQANVLKQIERSYDLYALRQYYPSGLSQEHVVWIMERLLSVIGFLHVNKIIHGAIEPGNILVTPENHNASLIDFVFAIPYAHLSDARYVGWNDYSAPEIKKKKSPNPASDLYSLGKSMEYLLGNAPADIRITQFIREFLHNEPAKRKDDAWKAWHELQALRTDIFGPKKFIELEVKEIKEITNSK